MGEPTNAVTHDPTELMERLARAANERRVPDGVFAPGFVMQQSVTSATDYAYHGAEGWMEWLRDILEHFDGDARFEIVDTLAVSDEYLVGTYRISGSSALSGQPLEVEWAGVTHFRDGLATSATSYGHPDEALAAVGLEP
ncbi:MAG TPA: nuclear transport factor 2 family protein [Solirubrobacteraceae bacterium]|nr:nuclear transport factor 2 family protein [Solirubrobacteraceae bacterium]